MSASTRTKMLLAQSVEEDALRFAREGDLEAAAECRALASKLREDAQAQAGAGWRSLENHTTRRQSRGPQHYKPRL